MDFIKRWIYGAISAWVAIGAGTLYVYFKGPLPSTESYLKEKYVRRVNDLEQLLASDRNFESILNERQQKRKLWKELRDKEEASKKVIQIKTNVEFV